MIPEVKQYVIHTYPGFSYCKKVLKHSVDKEHMPNYATAFIIFQNSIKPWMDQNPYVTTNKEGWFITRQHYYIPGGQKGSINSFHTIFHPNSQNYSDRRGQVDLDKYPNPESAKKVKEELTNKLLKKYPGRPKNREGNFLWKQLKKQAREQLNKNKGD